MTHSCLTLLGDCSDGASARERGSRAWRETALTAVPSLEQVLTTKQTA